MPSEDRLEQLLVRWEELRDSGVETSTNDLCGESPDLVAPLRRRIEALKEMDWLSGFLAPSRVSQLPAWPAQGSPGDLAPGTEPIAGYRLGRRLGRGGFGEVWQAEAPDGTPVALKFVPWDETTASAEFRAQAALDGIRHPHLLTVFGTWRTDHFLVIAMELAEQTLFDRLQEVQAQGLSGIPPGKLLEYFGQCAAAIDFLHERDIQHRDVKPQNLLLVKGEAKVGDFGLARLLAHSATGHTGLLTVAYAAPEFFDGRTTRHSDQYGLAITYCQLRGGRLPFRGTLAGMMAGHLQQSPDLSMLPDYERPVLERALAKQPAERWPSCQAFVQALSWAKESPLPSASRPSLKERDMQAGAPIGRPPPLQRNSFVAVMVGLLAAACLLPPLAKRLIPSPQFEMPSVPLNIRQVVVGRINPPLDRLVAFTNGGIGPLLWDVEGRRVLRGFPGGKSGPAVALAPFGSPYGLTGDDLGNVELWNLENGEEVRRLKGHTANISSVAFSPDGRYGLSGSDDGTVRYWDLKTGNQLKCCEGHQSFVTSVCFDPTGQGAISGGLDGRVICWDLNTGQPLWRVNPHTARVSSVVVSRDGRYVLSTGWDRTMKLLDTSENGKQLRSFEHDATEVTAAAFLNESDILASVVDRRVCVWDSLTGRRLHCSEEQPSGIQSMALLGVPELPAAVVGTSAHGLRFLNIPPEFLPGHRANK
jgi:serine/threonine protein kinase